MQVTPTSFTIAEYCDQMAAGSIIINHEYQRTNKVWPPAARSYLIDTVLQGYPIPKLCLFQKTDLKTRRTIKEIVDGQQRSQAFLDFYKDDLRITGKSSYSGRVYSQLDEPDQQKFISYSLSTDVFVNATEDDIRQVFRRMNSYTVPLNHQEKRHATHQGEFKWFIVELTERYAAALKMIGVFSESQLSRMADASLFTEIVLAMLDGIPTASQPKLNDFYERYEDSFHPEADIRKRIEGAFVLAWGPLHRGNMMRPYNFYCLLPAITHCHKPLAALSPIYSPTPQKTFAQDTVLANLSRLAVAQDQEESNMTGTLGQFAKAASSGTNTKTNRETRFKAICKALQPHRLA